MGSSRLPGKVLQKIDGIPMLMQVINRVRKSARISNVIVATSEESLDDPILETCIQNSTPCNRGSLNDVLDRIFQAARNSGADVVARITADCPLIDPELIDQTIDGLLGLETPDYIWSVHGDITKMPHPTNPDIPWDFAANRLPPPWKRTFPIGLDVEVCTFQALELAWKEATEKHQREHVMPFLYEVPNRFRCRILHTSMAQGDLRWTVDTPEDLEFVRRVYQRFEGYEVLAWRDVLTIVADDPDLKGINTNISHKRYDDIDRRT
jgi:spore coat polysaccharide biosynthesis protein SpsF